MNSIIPVHEARIQPSEGKVGAYYRLKRLGYSDTKIAEAWFESTATFDRWKRKLGIKAGKGGRYSVGRHLNI